MEIYLCRKLYILAKIFIDFSLNICFHFYIVYSYFLSFVFSKESNTSVEDPISNSTESMNPGILKKNPDENEKKVEENVQQKRGIVLFFCFDGISK